ncbi:TIGR03936 family radical SAM-associated protein [Aestuariimicrobium soli]|uniref:TIGR03936 family radical SAM-associated protein n=1 Tax=Aestuariimicrobium soli TaxID=2035834 RepID=UPI003EBC27D7
MSEASQSFSKRRHQPEQQAPPVQRLRLRYAKRGPARFTSHRDFSRAFERALRRADVPMAYSSGFTPHPRISYANASPTSAATEAEYLEIGLSEVCDPEKVRAALDDVLPPGLSVLAVAEAEGQALADRLTASAWRVDLGEGVDAEVLASAVAALEAADSFEVSRMTKNGLRTFDVRSAVVQLEVVDGGRLHLLSRHQTPLVRPDDVVSALRQLRPELGSARPALLTRLEQGSLTDDGGLIDPFTGASLHPW